MSVLSSSTTNSAAAGPTVQMMCRCGALIALLRNWARYARRLTWSKCTYSVIPGELCWRRNMPSTGQLAWYPSFWQARL